MHAHGHNKKATPPIHSCDMLEEKKRKGESAKKKHYTSWRLESKEKDEIRIKKHVSLILSFHIQGHNITMRIVHPNFYYDDTMSKVKSQGIGCHCQIAFLNHLRQTIKQSFRYLN